MQVALSWKLTDRLGMAPEPPKPGNPLFEWGAEWAPTWDFRRGDDILVLVNRATHFTVAAYPIRRKDLAKGIGQTIGNAIRNTLLQLNICSEAVEAYMALAGEIRFTKNSDSTLESWVGQACPKCAVRAKSMYARDAKVFDDTVASVINRIPIMGNGNFPEPRDSMIDALARLTGKPVFDYRAFEILVTLDLGAYEATRRLIVPANITFPELHRALKSVYAWKKHRMHDFTVLGAGGEPVAILFSAEDCPDKTLSEEGHVLSEYFPECSRILYVCDIGNSWGHTIQLVRTIENHDADSPYLMEAAGQTPPEYVRGVSEFVRFREIMLDPENEDYDEMKELSGGWVPELPKYRSKPGVVPII